MKLQCPVVVIVLMLTHSFGSAVAFGSECSCSPEIGNAKALVTSTCAKIWSNNQCTLKESGVAGSQPELEKWFQGVYSQVSGPRQIPSAGRWPFVAENSPDAVRFHQEVSNLDTPESFQSLERLVLVSIADGVRQGFAAAVINLLRRRQADVGTGWRGTRRVLDETLVQVVVDSQCLYAKSADENFYVNANAGSCRAAPAAK